MQIVHELDPIVGALVIGLRQVGRVEEVIDEEHVNPVGEDEHGVDHYAANFKLGGKEALVG